MPPKPPAFPLSPALLEDFRLKVKRRLPAGQVGGHLRRKQGQSLEFREHRRYLPGDDFRHIDWRATVRQGANADPLVRTYAAEERLTIALSVDTRPTMRLPECGEKLTIALWLARAIATIALAAGDRVLLHRLFGDAQDLKEVTGQHLPPHALAFLEGSTAVGGESFNGAALHRRLPPTSVWIVISDLYFDDGDRRWRELLTRAQEGARWVILVELDSWPAERALLAGPTLVDGPGLSTGPLRRDIDEAQSDRMTKLLRDHTSNLWEPHRRGSLDHVSWRWPAELIADGGASFFTERFLGEPLWKRLFARGA